MMPSSFCDSAGKHVASLQYLIQHYRFFRLWFPETRYFCHYSECHQGTSSAFKTPLITGVFGPPQSRAPNVKDRYSRNGEPRTRTGCSLLPGDPRSGARDDCRRRAYAFACPRAHADVFKP